MTTNYFNLLLVDDDPLVIQSIKLSVPQNWKVISCQSAENVHYNFHYHAAFIDMHLTNNILAPVGLKVVEKLRSVNPHLEIVAMSGHFELELMEAGIKSGANRFLAKPLIHEEFIQTIEKVEALVQIRERAFSSSTKSTRWVGSSQGSEEIRKNIASMRGEPGPILIEGESGSGKEVAAKLIHEQETARPWVTVNMASIPETLFESELFGHVKGAFTGADSNKVGLIEASSGGDLFLDEIEALPLNLQAKLLRFLETGEIRKVGAKESENISCRVIFASNRHLEEMVNSGEFREDLYWRISGKKVKLSPLRERKNDIRDLCDFFITIERPRRNKRFSDDGIVALQNYNWPGNVRELKRVCEQLSLMTPLPIIRGIDVESLLKLPTGLVSTSSTSNLSSHSAKNISGNSNQGLPSTSLGVTVNLELGLNELVSQFEKHVIELTLQKYKDTAKVIEVLQISRSSLYKKLKDLNIETD
jgi:DNA-binding NtrC family response regulator